MSNFGSQKYDGRISRYREILYDTLHSKRRSLATIDSLDVPTHSGIYFVFENNSPVYVGSSSDLRRRVMDQLAKARNHYLASQLKKRRFGGDQEKTRKFLTEDCLVSWREVSAAFRAEWVERFCQSILKPKYNQLKAIKDCPAGK